MRRKFWQTVLIYAALFAAAALTLIWFEHGHFSGRITAQAYIGFLAITFVCLGIWVGVRITRRPTAKNFERNEAALRTLQISGRELEVLEAMAMGQTNKEIARSLKISPNTIKTHIANLFAKLDVDRRFLAIEKARSLRLIA